MIKNACSNRFDYYTILWANTVYIYCTYTVSNATFKRRIFKHNKDCSDVTTHKF